MATEGRDQRLDVLRGVAVLLVVVHHSRFAKALQGGWSGVDLFFVLSGFLVSGLLFKEYQTTGQILPWRFYFRRGLKIYPSYYLLLFATAPLHLLAGVRPDVRLWPQHAVFLQNYLGLAGWWGHTWTLAVEEHFYLLLVPTVLLLVDSERFRRAPVRWASIVMVLLAAPLLVWRCVLVARGVDTVAIVTKTHLRLDSFAFGVLLSVLWHFAPERLDTVRRLRLPLLVVGCLLTAPAFLVSPYHPYISSVGPTVLYLGYGSILMAALSAPARLAGPATPALAYLGVHSYSIYLWHVPIRLLLSARGHALDGIGTVLYFVGSVVVGVLMAKAVELPVLRLRDRWFPRATVPATTGDPRRAAATLRRILRAAALALAALFASHSLLGAAARFSGADPNRSRTWVSAGRSCPLDARTDEAGAAPCLPGYPTAVMIAGEIFALRAVPAGRVVAATATAGALFMVALLLSQAGLTRQLSGVLLAALLPGFIWWHTVLPLSAVAGLSMASVVLGDRGYFLGAGACGAAAAFTHPIGGLVAVPLSMQAARLPSLRNRTLALIAGVGLAVAGWAGARAWSPVLAASASPAAAEGPQWNLLVTLHATVASALLALAAVHWFRQRQSRPPLDAALLTHAALVWFVAVWAGSEARLQFPAVAIVGVVPMLTRLRSMTMATLLAVSLALGCLMSSVFFAGLAR